MWVAQGGRKMFVGLQRGGFLPLVHSPGILLIRSCAFFHRDGTISPRLLIPSSFVLSFPWEPSDQRLLESIFCVRDNGRSLVVVIPVVNATRGPLTPTPTPFIFLSLFYFSSPSGRELSSFLFSPLLFSLSFGASVRSSRQSVCRTHLGTGGVFFLGAFLASFSSFSPVNVFFWGLDPTIYAPSLVPQPALRMAASSSRRVVSGARRAEPFLFPSERFLFCFLHSFIPSARREFDGAAIR
jgi:hypothetical protein